MKSQILGVILTLFTGPVGLLYSSFFSFLIMTALLLMSLKNHAHPQVFPTIWLSCVLISIISVRKHNKKYKHSSASSHRSRSSSTKSTDTILRNRCSGCEYYNGFYQGGGYLVQCGIGEKVSIDRGCDKFKPDITASCQHCYYNSKTLMDIRCSIHGDLKNEKQYCKDYSLKWND